MVKTCLNLALTLGLWFFGPAAPAWGQAEARFSPSSGLFSPEIVVDEKGRKTLVIHGGQDEIQAETLPPTGPSGRRALAGDEIKSPAAGGPPGGKPYWVVETRAPERPYFQAEEKAPESPYWLEREERDDRPYWQVRERAPERPYWELAPERVEIISGLVEPAAAAPPPGPEPAGDIRTISYFMYRDETGTRHLTNVPVDPRYREFTVTVRLQRGLAGGRPSPSRFTRESLRPAILRAAAIYNLDPALIAAVIKSESAFDAHAVSWAGAQGLMQLMPATARAMGCADSFDPDQNIMAGSRYLREMLNTFGGDLTLALASYNCGPERVKRHWRVPDIPETRNYVLIVSRNYERYKGQL